MPYGHSCTLDFTAFFNEIDPLFAAPDVAKSTLTFVSTEDGFPLLEIKGIVTEKSFVRMVSLSSDEKEKLLRLWQDSRRGFKGINRCWLSKEKMTM